jgi:hypothetical protein
MVPLLTSWLSLIKSGTQIFYVFRILALKLEIHLQEINDPIAIFFQGHQTIMPR